ncbi:MAG: ribonuclease III [Treponema sp.]|nr:ribonuclease III [Treponema sp.]
MTEISRERKNLLLKFCRNIKISFKNLSLLNKAFCHRSITNENKGIANNERLEFLGDSVLGMVTASFLYNHLENKEGDLAKIKSAVVSEKALAPVARKFNVPELLIISHGEEISGGRDKNAILADCMEAIIGAYYLDSGYKAAEKFVLEFIKDEIEKVLENGIGSSDYKSVLQEKYQKLTKKLPVYELVSKSGPDHKQLFTVQVKLGQKIYGPASAYSKKEAEQLAAQIALKDL